jgi:hypothetical protein
MAVAPNIALVVEGAKKLTDRVAAARGLKKIGRREPLE